MRWWKAGPVGRRDAGPDAVAGDEASAMAPRSYGGAGRSVDFTCGSCFSLAPTGHRTRARIRGPGLTGADRTMPSATHPFTDAERTYLTGQMLGRLATIGPDGTPQNRALGFRLNDDGTIDLGGPWVVRTQRYRNVRRNPRVSFVVDDLTPDEPGRIKPGMGRGVEIRGVAETTRATTSPVDPSWPADVIRIHPTRILSWHIDPETPDGYSRDVG